MRTVVVACHCHDSGRSSRRNDNNNSNDYKNNEKYGYNGYSDRGPSRPT